MLISLVMAAYNAEPYIEEAVSGIIQQTYKNWECIVVNDGSTDRTGEILNGIPDTRFKIIHLPNNRGAALALNTGIASARGEWIAIHDADDVSLPHRLETQVEFVKSKPGLVAAGSFIECIPGGTGTLGSPDSNSFREFAAIRNRIQDFNDVKEILFHVSFLTHGTMLIKKRALIEAGGYNPSFKIAYDYDLWTRLVRLGPVENVPEVLYRYRVYPGSLSQKDVITTGREIFRAVSGYILDSMKQKGLDRKPEAALVGPEKGCRCFVDEAKDSFHIKKVTTGNFQGSLINLLYQYKKGSIDFFILLNNTPGINLLCRKLEENGLSLNEEYFVIWSAVS